MEGHWDEDTTVLAYQAPKAGGVCKILLKNLINGALLEMCMVVLARGGAPQPPPHTLHKTQQGPSRC